MTKEQFEKFDKDTVYCECCNRTLDVRYFSYHRIHLDGTALKCKSCDWIFRHKGLPIIDGFSEEQIKCALEFILFEKSLYINDLADELNISIDGVIKLVNGIKVGGKKYMLKGNCEYCGEEVEKFVSVYLKNKHLFCSHDCYWKYKREIEPNGSKHPSYNRIVTNCTNCGKEIKITPFDYNKTNQYGDNHNFCSQQCYWEYRKKYYIGDKSSRIGATLSEEQITKMMIGLAEWCKDDKRLNSNIQLKVNSILDENNIKYEREYLVKYYSIDNYLNDSGLMIEVMGDYWHGSPLKYNSQTTGLNKTQLKDVQYDKQKHTYVKKYHDVEILYLWEKDVNENIELCKKLILEYISNSGVLENYHSFNYHIVNNELKLNEKIIIPYQNMKVDKYRNLLEEKAG